MLLGLTQDQLIQLGIVILLAALPAIIWAIVIFRGRKASRWKLFIAFFIGTLTVLPIMALNYLWIWFPDLDIYKAIEVNVTEVHFAAFITLVVVAVTEELSKSWVVRIIDKTKINIHTVNDAVKYSILAGLGFAFTENIFYFYYIWQSAGIFGLIFPLIFRSIFTVSGHMIFSGIFGYYYGIGKFANPIMQTKLWMGEKSPGVRIMSKIMGTNEAIAFRQWMLVKGILIAMIVHTFFNFFLEFENLIPVVVLVVGGFGYLLYLLAHKAGAIAFAGMGRQATIAQKDEDVVLELLGMWTKEGRYKDVVDICQRLLMRDPDNKIVQLFQAKAVDAAKLSKLENSFSSLFKSEEERKDDKSLRALVKQKVLMEMLKEKQQTSPAAPTAATPSAPAQTTSVTPAPAPQPSVPQPSVPSPVPPPSQEHSDQSSQQDNS